MVDAARATPERGAEVKVILDRIKAMQCSSAGNITVSSMPNNIRCNRTMSLSTSIRTNWSARGQRADPRTHFSKRELRLTNEWGESAARKVIWPLPNDFDHLLKLNRGKFGHYLADRTQLINQKERRGNGGRYTVLGGLF